MAQVYSIRLVPSDLRPEETILQMMDTLGNLNTIVNDLFKRIDGRINQNVARTQKITDRISECVTKVDKLTGTTKAVKVFSNAKYPSANVYKNYKSIFDIKKLDFESKLSPAHIKSKPGPYSDKALQEKLDFYHVKVEKPIKENNYRSGVIKDVGQIPDNLESLDSLLIFNTDICPYKGYSADTMGHAKCAPDVKVESSSLARNLEAPPLSMSQRDQLLRKEDGFLYNPDMGEVPELDMPLDLPHLPGIAGDVQFSQEAEPTIAPSALTSPVSPLAYSKFQPSDVQADSAEPDTSVLPDVDCEEDSNINVLVVVEGKVEDDSGKVPKEALSPPPPPPPPPPPCYPAVNNEKTETDNAKLNKECSKVSNPPESGDAHTSLMAAIRKAGGAAKAKLRAASDVETTTKKSASSGGGDLMADLHARLSMRRKGISGAGESSMMQKISDMIPDPAPTELSNAELSSNDDDGWD